MRVIPAKLSTMRDSYLCRVLLLAVAATLVSVPFLTGCDSLNQDRRPAKERKNMELAKGYWSQDVAIPPIDLKAPKKTETATFALG